MNVFLVIWLIVPVIFFSISQSKLPGYILPAVPAGALLSAEYVRRQRMNERPETTIAILHSILAAAPIIPALLIEYLVLQHRVPWGKASLISGTFAAVVAAGLCFTLRSRVGWAGLRFTLVPVALAVAAVLRLGAPALDTTLSARPIADEIKRVGKSHLPSAGFRISREIEFGLGFYRNQKVERYELGEIPQQAHLLVAPEGSQVEIARQVPGRHVSYLGSFAPQGLDYYWVAGAGNTQ